MMPWLLELKDPLSQPNLMNPLMSRASLRRQLVLLLLLQSLAISTLRLPYSKILTFPTSHSQLKPAKPRKLLSPVSRISTFRTWLPKVSNLARLMILHLWHFCKAREMRSLRNSKNARRRAAVPRKGELISSSLMHTSLTNSTVLPQNPAALLVAAQPRRTKRPDPNPMIKRCLWSSRYRSNLFQNIATTSNLCIPHLFTRQRGMVFGVSFYVKFASHPSRATSNVLRGKRSFHDSIYFPFFRISYMACGTEIGDRLVAYEKELLQSTG